MSTLVQINSMTMRVEQQLASAVSSEMLEAIPMRGCISVRLPNFDECRKARQIAGATTLRLGKGAGWMLKTMMHPNAPIIYIHKLATYE